MKPDNFLSGEEPLAIEVRMKRLLGRRFRDQDFIEEAKDLIFEAGQQGRTDTGVYSQLCQELDKVSNTTS